MHYLDHLFECPIGPSLKVVQLRQLFDWTNKTAALPQFFGAARHPCVEVRCQWSDDSPLFNITDYFTNYENVSFNNTMNVCDIEYNLLLLVYKLHLSINVYDFMTHFNKSLKT